MGKFIKFQVRFSAEQKKEAKLLAKNEGVSFSEIVRRAINDYLKGIKILKSSFRQT